jgi:hypothetical protein
LCHFSNDDTIPQYTLPLARKPLKLLVNDKKMKSFIKTGHIPTGRHLCYNQRKKQEVIQMAEFKVGDSVLYKGGKKAIKGKVSKIEKNKQNKADKYLIQCEDGVLVECTAKELEPWK